MRLETPEGWVRCEIGEVTQVVSGGTPRAKDPSNFVDEGGIPWITPADLSGYTDIFISRGARNLSEKGFYSCSAAKIPAGSVLFSSRAPVGYVAIAANELATNQGFKNFVLPNGLDSRFIYFYLKYIKPVAENMATGTTFKELSGKVAAKLPLLIAPTEEQTRIADKLENLIARVDACRDRLTRIPNILKKYRQAVLRAAMSGELTEDWRKANSDFETDSDLFLSLQNKYGGERSKGHDSLADDCSELSFPENWLYVPTKAVGEVFLGRQRSPKNHNGPHMRPYMRAANITWKGLDLSDVKEMNFDPSDFERFKLQVGDVLVNEGSGSAEEVGKPAIWNGEIENCCFQNTLICVRPFEDMSEYLYFVFLNAALSKDFIKETRGIGIHHLGKTRFAAFKIPLPPLEEQKEIVRCIKYSFAYVERLEAYYQKANCKVEKITNALLSKAFQGELVSQKSSDEPASALMERLHSAIKIQNANASKAKRKKEPLPISRLGSVMLKRENVNSNYLSEILRKSGSMSPKNLWSLSQLEIDDFYEQLKEEEENGLLREISQESDGALRLLEVV